ncbi:hypothetical protein LRS06_19885 [Hymenobacter sp. J193]|uniref:hypothetical protein n=1 Tax=Hymenobacter sp. J193 TaxID=2898429 RepID=UPI002151802B|nr:hypothetical protein [Hymenobacter sp. J193]MCR5889990.1 hypothetical protein [Hymenobacter sp. J193]
MQWDGTTWAPVHEGTSGPVYALASQGTDVYAGGDFRGASGGRNTKNFARWTGTDWRSVGNGLSDDVQSIAIMGKDVYVAGSFVAAGGNPAANCIAKWDGTSWQSLGNYPENFAGSNDVILTLLVVGKDLYVGGEFTTPAVGIARWDGQQWHALAASDGTKLGGYVYTLYAYGTDIYMGGTFCGFWF